jgi:phosphohistidine phosphatase
VRRHLLLLRHAKSSWDHPALPDHDRPLAPRGEKAVAKLRQQLAEMAVRPEVVLCSSARRTVQTLEGIRAALPPTVTVVVEPGLYLADEELLLHRLRRLDPDVRCAMLIGHNPGTEDLAGALVGAGDAGLRYRLAEKYPTGALAHLTFRGSWPELAPGTARLEDFFVPRRPRPAP